MQPDNRYDVMSMRSPIAVAEQESVRARFIRRTYGHLALAVALFVAIEAIIFNVVPSATLERTAVWMLSGWNWLLVLGGFMVVSMVAERMAYSATGLGTQYLGLGLYVVCEAIIFIPILVAASLLDARAGGGDHLILKAALITLFSFGGLTSVVMVTKADFSWMRNLLLTATFVALGIIVAGVLFGFSIGLFGIGVFIALSVGWILYQTSAVLHHVHEDQYVAASLALFASLAMLFWYVLQFIMASRD